MASARRGISDKSSDPARPLARSAAAPPARAPSHAQDPDLAPAAAAPSSSSRPLRSVSSSAARTPASARERQHVEVEEEEDDEDDDEEEEEEADEYDDHLQPRPSAAQGRSPRFIPRSELGGSSRLSRQTLGGRGLEQHIQASMTAAAAAAAASEQAHDGQTHAAPIPMNSPRPSAHAAAAAATPLIAPAKPSPLDMRIATARAAALTSVSSASSTGSSGEDILSNSPGSPARSHGNTTSSILGRTAQRPPSRTGASNNLPTRERRSEINRGKSKSATAVKP